MSVILTGMDMPKNCVECDWKREGMISATCSCEIVHKTICEELSCPLKSVNGLIEKIERIGGNEEKSTYKNLHPSYVQGLKDTIRIIKEYCEMEE